ncbi:MAG: GspMb/PilO family protein [Pyrinomonadaceae bacterium]
MSDPNLRENQEASAKTNRRAQLRVRVDSLRRSRSSSIFGVAEIAGLAASLVLLIVVVIAYLFFLTPARTRLADLQREREQLQTKLRHSQEGVQQEIDTHTSVANLTGSIDDFETNRLSDRNAGRMVLYSQLNTLIRRNGLRNTSGPTYVSLEALGADGKTTASNTVKGGNAKLQSIYPGIGVGVTVEGQYQSLRHFLRDIEASNQFLVINAVELEGVTDTNARTVSAADTTLGTTPVDNASPRGSLVSLRLNMAAYFRRGEAGANLIPANETR